MTVNRRSLLQGAAVAISAAALSSLPGPVQAKIAVAQPKQRSGKQVPGIYRTQVGSIEVTSILDGGMNLGLELFATAPKDGLEAQQKASFQDPGPVKAYLNAFVINTGTQLILVDSGGGVAMGDTVGKLQQNLAAAGFSPSDITDVYLTHGHIDHVSGLIDGAGKQAFPQALIRISEAELQFWFDDTMRDKAPEGAKGLFAAARQALTPYRELGGISTFKPGSDLTNGITSVDLTGHTPGHCGFRVSDGQEQLLIWGDIVHAPALQFAHPEWSIAFDTDQAKALETRNKILAEVATDRVRVAGMHLGFPALGHVAKAGTGYDFVPQVWEI